MDVVDELHVDDWIYDMKVLL
jgi:hypothetical protein